MTPVSGVYVVSVIMKAATLWEQSFQNSFVGGIEEKKEEEIPSRSCSKQIQAERIRLHCVQLGVRCQRTHKTHHADRKIAIVSKYT